MDEYRAWKGIKELTLLVIPNHAQFIDGGIVLQGCYIAAKGDLTGFINHKYLDWVDTGEDVQEWMGEHGKGAEKDRDLWRSTTCPLEFTRSDDILDDALIEVLMPTNNLAHITHTHAECTPANVKVIGHQELPVVEADIC